MLLSPLGSGLRTVGGLGWAVAESLPMPYLQLVVVKMCARTWLQASVHMFSRLRQRAAAPPLVGTPSNMPLWHNVLFRNKLGHTYSSPSHVRKGISTLAQIVEGG